MKLNKEKFLKSELGGNLQECVTAWDHWLTELRKFNIDTVGQKYRETRKAADWCQAQWEVFQTVMRQFYNDLWRKPLSGFFPGRQAGRRGLEMPKLRV